MGWRQPGACEWVFVRSDSVRDNVPQRAGAVGEVAGVGDQWLPAVARSAESAGAGADLPGGLLDAPEARDRVVQLALLVGA
jgi:hypothetical protein